MRRNMIATAILRIRTRSGVQGPPGAGFVTFVMEDAATAEISRTQNWQWLRYGATLADGRKVTPELVEAVLTDEMQKLKASLGEAFERGRFNDAIALFRRLVLSKELEPFLTLPAYQLIA